jgi:uncharacterized membrane protein YbhN (UPF0104 family)
VSKYLRIGVTAALLGVLACKLFFSGDLPKVAATFVNLQVGWWLLAVALLAFTQVVSAWRWREIARPLGFARPLRQMTGFYYIGMYFNLILPTSVGGDVVRAWYLDGYSGKRLQAFASVFLDRLSGLMVLLLMACVAVLLSPLPVPRWVMWFTYGTAGCAVLGLTALPLLARHSEKVSVRLRRLRGALLALRSPRVLLLSTLSSLFVQAANVLVVWLVGLAIGADIPWSFYWILVPMVSLLTLVPISVGGTGVRENAMPLFLAPLGIGDGVAVPLALLWFAVTVVTSLCGGVVYLCGRFPKPEAPASLPDEEQADNGPVDRDPDQGRARQLGTAA